MKTSRRFGLIVCALFLYSQFTAALPGNAVNVSKKTGNQSESFIVINPTNPLNIVAFSNEASAANTFRAYSFDGGSTWTGSDINIGAACCDGQSVAYDEFGNLFLVYIDSGVSKINLIASTDGGVTFSSPTTVGTGGIDQPSLAAGNGSIWVDWNSGGNMVARGAPVTGLGAFGPFAAQQSIPSASGSFGGIAVGPGTSGSGKVIVVYQNPTGGEGPATIYANVDPDGLGAMGFGSRVTVTTTNVGGFDFIPAQSGRSVDAEVGVAWDGTGGPFNGRIYLVYTDETAPENNDTEIFVRTSNDDGATWSARTRVNDDATTRSQFNPYISMDEKTGGVGVTFHDARNDTGVPGPGGTNGTPNDDAQYFATYSTNGGATWAANLQLSCGFSNAADAGNGIDYGDYVGTDTYCGVVFGAWADNSNCTGDNPNGTLNQFDLYARARAFLPVDLAVNKSDGGVTSGPGGTIAYTLSYSNSGRLATGVVLSDTVPANTTFNAAASSAGWSCPTINAGSVCTLNTGTLIGCGGSGSATFAVTVDSPLPGGVTLITNTATISDDGTNGTDGNPSDNSSTDTTPVSPAPDLSIVKSDGGASVSAGGTVAYTLNYSNTGAVGSTGVELNETVPADSIFNAGASTAGWACVPDNNAGSACTLAIGGVPSGSGGSATFAVTVVDPVPAGVLQISNTATIHDDGANGTDPTPGNNTSSDTTPVSAAPDLSLSKSDGGVNVVAGASVAYTLSYANNGSQSATGVALTETVPAETTFNAGASTAGWVCVPNGNPGSVCTLSIGSVAGGGGNGSAVFAVTVNNPVTAGVTQISNTASIADDGSGGADPTPGNNTSTDTTPVIAACLFCDDFEDGILAPPGVWSYTGASWSESGGVLIGASSTRKTTAVANPVFSGCLNCYVEAQMQSAGGAFSRISLFGWYIDKKNNVELMMDADRGRWLLKQRVAGSVARKAKFLSTINPGQLYKARITFDGAAYSVTIDGSVIITVSPGASVPGTVGFRVKRTTGTFAYVEVN